MRIDGVTLDQSASIAAILDQKGFKRIGTAMVKDADEESLTVEIFEDHITVEGNMKVSSVCEMVNLIKKVAYSKPDKSIFGW